MSTDYSPYWRFEEGGGNVSDIDNTSDTAVSGQDGKWKVRAWTLVNIVCIPYVAVAFPRELPGYLHRCWEAVVFGRGER